MQNRLQKVRQKLTKIDLDALFISNQFNVSYLTGFTGLSQDEREGFLFITPKNAYLLTFPTYFGLFEKGGEGFSTLCITHEKRLGDQLTAIIKKEKICSIGFEEENLTIAELTLLKKKVSCHSEPRFNRGEESPSLPESSRDPSPDYVGIRMTTYIQWRKTKGIVENLRSIKDETELSHIRQAAKITDQAFTFIKGQIKKGATEKELALKLEFFLKKNSHGVAFSPIVAFDEHAAIPHYLPSSDQPASPAGRRLTTNSLILMDFGARVKGYCADMTRIVFYGKPADWQVKIYQTVLAAQMLALKNIRIGMKGEKADEIARDYILSQGYPEYPHGLGHGVGLDIHEDPRLKKDSKIVLQENMVVTVEPGIYLPGDCGVRIEDLVVLKEAGVEILTQSSKEMIII